MSKFDDLLKQIGTGAWNVFVVVAMLYWIPQIANQHMGAAFLTPDLHHTCRLPSDAVSESTNDTRSQCMYNATTSGGGTEERPCFQWDFDNSTYTNTITSEFNLVCDRGYFRAAFKSVFFFGSFFGAMLNGWLSDRLGRKIMLTVGSVSFTFMSVILPWLPSVDAMLSFRFFMGLMDSTSVHAGYTLAMEVTEPKYRATVGILIYLPWALYVIILGGYGYLLRDWRWLSVTTSLPALLFLPVLLLLDESPRWLIVRGRYDDALQVLRKAARWNKAELPAEGELLALMDDIKKETLLATKESEGSASGFVSSVKNIVEDVIVLVRTRRMRSITLSFYAQSFVLGMVYYGLSFGADKLGVDPFAYMAISGVMEIPGGTVTIPLAEKMGRRSSSTLFFVVTAGSLLVLGFIPTTLEWLVLTMAMVGRLAITAAYQIVILYVSELFPTEVRVRGIGTCSMMSASGAILAPFILEILGSIRAWVPLVMFGVASFLASVTTFWLPESRTAPMLDTVASLEAAHKEAKDPRDPRWANEHTEEVYACGLTLCKIRALWRRVCYGKILAAVGDTTRAATELINQFRLLPFSIRTGALAPKTCKPKTNEHGDKAAFIRWNMEPYKIRKIKTKMILRKIHICSAIKVCSFRYATLCITV
ncbi:organic cation transporter protein-like [Penaeus japonicus]|uniref:organic cation transporter protein-like n=1 Tax=Penaeus japonicus TaxID=27405 RepID=UPI001C70FA77|nr:organic cation transporter protein-like [Penaeus japonicus]